MDGEDRVRNEQGHRGGRRLVPTVIRGRRLAFPVLAGRIKEIVLSVSTICRDSAATG